MVPIVDVHRKIPGFQFYAIGSTTGNQSQGSNIASYSPTREVDGTIIMSICAMPIYKGKSNEELRSEYYELHIKGSTYSTKNRANGFQQSKSPFGPSTVPVQSSQFCFGAKSPFDHTSVLPTTGSVGSIGNSITNTDQAPRNFGASSYTSVFAVPSKLGIGLESTPTTNLHSNSSHVSMSLFGPQSTCTVGSKVASYSETDEVENVMKIQSISAMPIYKDKSHEELRSEDCELVRIKGSSTFSMQNQGNAFQQLNSCLAPNNSGVLHSNSAQLSFGPWSGRPNAFRFPRAYVSDESSKPVENIPAMPFHKDKTREELRSRNYELVNKGRACPSNNDTFMQEEDLSNILKQHPTVTEKHDANVLALVPKLPDGEYYTEPSKLELESKERSEPGLLSRVNNFTIGRRGYGSIMFLGETDIRELDLESVVRFKNREVIVYVDNTKKPKIGQGLNKPAEITLLNVKCISKKTGKQYVDGPQVHTYREMLIDKCAQEGLEFVSYDPVQGEWKFRVQHF